MKMSLPTAAAEPLVARTGQPLELFVPTSRSAIIVNGMGLDSMRSGATEYSSIHPTADCKSSRSMFEIAAALTGIALLPKKLAARVSEEMQRGWQRDITYYLKALEKRSCDRRPPSLRNVHLYHLMPEVDMRVSLAEAIWSIREHADENHLTIVYIDTHGAEMGFTIGIDVFMGYQGLFSRLDTILGKKIIMLSTCHSDNVHAYLDGHARKKDYSVFSLGDGEAMIESAVEFADRFVDAMIQTLLISQISMNQIHLSNAVVFPRGTLSFDVVL